MKVKSLDEFGRLILEFNEPMKNDMNLMFLNSSISTIGRYNDSSRVDHEEKKNLTNLPEIKEMFKNILDIYVVPNEDWNLDVDDFKM